MQAPHALALAPLGNGYSAVPEGNTVALQQVPSEIAAQSAMQRHTTTPVKAKPSVSMPGPTAQAMTKSAATGQKPRLSVRMEKGADEILSRKDGVSAAVGAALTATLTSNPAAVLVGGLAGIWVGDKQVSDCNCGKMQLGEKTSNLFRRVSKTLFKGGRYLVDSTKRLAKKTGDTAHKMRTANAPMPLKGQEPLVSRETNTALTPRANVPPPEQAQAPVVVSPTPKANTATPKAKQAQSPVLFSASPKAAIPEVNLNKKPVVAASVPATRKPAAKRSVEKAKKRHVQVSKMPKKQNVAKKKATQVKVSPAPKPASPSKKPRAVKEYKVLAVTPMDAPIKNKKPIVRAHAKKLQPMPKLNVADMPIEPKVSKGAERHWPEKAVTQTQDEPAKQRFLNSKPRTQPGKPLKAYSAPAEADEMQAAEATQAIDCDTQGDKISRGRLAWLECYYRME